MQLMLPDHSVIFFWITDSKVLSSVVLILQLVMYHQPNVMVLTKEVPPSHYFLIWDNYSSFARLAYRAKKIHCKNTEKYHLQLPLKNVFVVSHMSDSKKIRLMIFGPNISWYYFTWNFWVCSKRPAMENSKRSSNIT